MELVQIDTTYIDWKPKKKRNLVFVQLREKQKKTIWFILWFKVDA